MNVLIGANVIIFILFSFVYFGCLFLGKNPEAAQQIAGACVAVIVFGIALSKAGEILDITPIPKYRWVILSLLIQLVLFGAVIDCGPRLAQRVKGNFQKQHLKPGARHA